VIIRRPDDTSSFVSDTDAQGVNTLSQYSSIQSVFMCMIAHYAILLS